MNAAAEQENEDDMEEMEPMDTSELPDDETNEGKKKEKVIMKQIVVESEDRLLAMTRSLSEEQMMVLGPYVDYAKRLKVFKNCPPTVQVQLDPPQIIATGGAGTGKTWVILVTSQWVELILRVVGNDPSKPKILILAPTGVAADLINGTTIHTGLGFHFGSRKYLPLLNEKREFYRKKFEELEMVIIDEFSMLSSDRLYDIHRRLQEILISTDLFGGKAMLIVGDIMQLAPVKGRPIYSCPFSSQSKAMFRDESLNIWNNMEVVSLVVNQRQGVSQYTECLNRARVGDLTEEDKELLESRRLKNFPDFDPDKACHVMYENLCVNNHNMRILNANKNELVHIKSEGLYPRGYKLKLKPHGTIEDTSFRKDLYLKKGSRVILTFNVSLSDSLVNGSMGTVLDFIFEGKRVKAVIVQFDNPNIGIEQRREHVNHSSQYAEQNGTPIYRQTLKHSLNNGKSGAQGKTIAFPLRLGEASTGHTFQGLTIKKGSDLVCHGRPKNKKGDFKIMPKNMYYVMLSRCSSVNNVYLDDNIKLEEIACDNGCLVEKKRLEAVSIAVGIKQEVFDIFFINIRSFSKHQEDLQCDVFAKRSACLCLVETWLDPAVHTNHSFGEKVMYEASVRHGNGTCALVPDGCPLVANVATETFQLVSFLYKENIQVIVTYMSQRADIEAYVQALKSIENVSMDKLLIGDYNFDVREKNLLSVYMDGCNLQQMIQEPTHEAGRTLDHLYLSPNLVEKLEVKLVFKYYSDHAAMQIKLNI